jgi:hypothetical protein
MRRIIAPGRTGRGAGRRAPCGADLRPANVPAGKMGAMADDSALDPIAAPPDRFAKQP